MLIVSTLIIRTTYRPKCLLALNLGVKNEFLLISNGAFVQPWYRICLILHIQCAFHHKNDVNTELD